MIKKLNAILVGVEFPRSEFPASESLEELEQLADTLGICAVARVIQHLNRPHPKYFIGPGKAEELRELCIKTHAGVVLFDDQLSAGQQKNLAELLPAEIIERARLILNIFARRARTKEAKLQVELAQRYYQLPRVKGKTTGWEQQIGDIGVRGGAGEKKIETDRRVIRDKISHLKKEIEKIAFHRETQRAKRETVPVPVVSLVGYTNVGKSTLLNYLTHKNTAYADNKLFTTLDTTTRKVKLPDGRMVLFTDTVGFIKKLPHQLVAAFKSTLEETVHSDLILHIIDISRPNSEECKNTVRQVLKEIGADKIPIIEVYNKCDKSDIGVHNSIQSDNYISAKTGQGIHKLLENIAAKLQDSLSYKTFTVQAEKLAAVMAKIRTVGKIISCQMRGTDAELEILIDEKNWGQLKKIYLNGNQL